MEEHAVQNVPKYNNLFTYQRDHLLTLGASFDINDTTIDASDTGTGKTYTASALAHWKQRKAFVVCPKPVVESWFNILTQFGVEILGIANYEAIKNGKYYRTIAMFKRDKREQCPYIRVIKNEDGETDFEWVMPHDSLVIFDEAHKGKNHITINSQLLVSTKKMFASGVKMLILSATITDKVDCFRVAAYLLGLSQYGKHAYRAWLRQLVGLNPGGTEEDSIHKIIYPRYGSRMCIRDLRENDDESINKLFKNNDVQAMCYDMSPETESEIVNAYQDIKEAIAALKTKQLGETCILTVILRARQRIEMLKVPTMIMLAMEYLLNGNSVVIFVNFNETATSLFESLDDFVQKEIPGSFITFINGDQTVEDRAYNIASFQSDRSRLMLANIRAGGVGVSLHDLNGNFPRVSLISPTWSSIDLKQVIGRIYRADAKSDSVQRIIYCRGRISPAGPEGHSNDATFADESGARKIGVEERIAESVNKKLRTIEWINNGDGIQDDEIIQI